jgi:hypothetical protein
VKDAHSEIYVDDNDEIFETEKINPKTGKVEYWVAQQVVYDLGKVLETDIHNK